MKNKRIITATFSDGQVVTRNTTNATLAFGYQAKGFPCDERAFCGFASTRDGAVKAAQSLQPKFVEVVAVVEVSR